MCAPGSKLWDRYSKWVRGWFLVLSCTWWGYWTTQQIIPYDVSYFVESEMAYLAAGVIPPYAPSKTYISQEAQWELQGAQEYVAALAAHDLANTGNVFAAAAFDLRSSSVMELSQGLADWSSFLSPSQQHIHALTAQIPMSWGSIADEAAATLVGLHAQQTWESSAPITLWLASYLRGGARKHKPGRKHSGDPGDNGTDPQASSSVAVARKRPAM